MRRAARGWLPARRSPQRDAVRWATTAVAALPEHTHAAHLIGLVPPPPPGLPIHAGQAVWRALEDSPATCLQRCLVLQAWLAAHGQQHEVAVGFRTDGGFQAHAWIPGVQPEDEAAGFLELARVPPPGSGATALRRAAS